MNPLIDYFDKPGEPELQVCVDWLLQRNDPTILFAMFSSLGAISGMEWLRHCLQTYEYKFKFNSVLGPFCLDSATDYTTSIQFLFKTNERYNFVELENYPIRKFYRLNFVRANGDRDETGFHIDKDIHIADDPACLRRVIIEGKDRQESLKEVLRQAISTFLRLEYCSAELITRFKKLTNEKAND